MKRKYFRKCGICDKRQEQSEMKRVREDISPNGWICKYCYDDIKYEKDLFDEYEIEGDLV